SKYTSTSLTSLGLRIRGRAPSSVGALQALRGGEGMGVVSIKELLEAGVHFVGTKRQAAEILQEEAVRANMFYVNQRWLGGMLTNFQTIRRSIDKMKK